jgi:hypothetical protein
MEEFMHSENLKILKRQLALAKDDVRRRFLLRLLAEEEARIPVAARQPRHNPKPVCRATGHELPIPNIGRESIAAATASWSQHRRSGPGKIGDLPNSSAPAS